MISIFISSLQSLSYIMLIFILFDLYLIFLFYRRSMAIRVLIYDPDSFFSSSFKLSSAVFESPLNRSMKNSILFL